MTRRKQLKPRALTKRKYWWNAWKWIESERGVSVGDENVWSVERFSRDQSFFPDEIQKSILLTATVICSFCTYTHQSMENKNHFWIYMHEGKYILPFLEFSLKFKHLSEIESFGLHLLSILPHTEMSMAR